MNLGDFVRHIRQGPGRITHVLPEYVEVKSAAGNVYKVNRAVADAELVPVPPDGFTAMLATRNPSSEFLLQNIVDVTQRIFRDRRKSSLSKSDLRQELEPWVKREGKSYASWWKRAQKQLLDSGVVVVDPKKKTNLVIAGELSSRRNIDWKAELVGVDRENDLLEYARRLHAAGAENDDLKEAADTVLDRVTRQLHAAGQTPRARLELALVLSYIGSCLDPANRNKWGDIVDGLNLASLPVARDLDDDIAVALTLMSRLIPRKAAEWATVLLSHPSPAVVKRAFIALNNDRFRLKLKKPILQWLQSSHDSTVPPNLDLYLDDAFLPYLRSEDKAALFVRLSQQSAPSETVRRFLSQPDYAKAAAKLYGADAGSALQAISAKSLDQVGRSNIVKALGADAVLEQVLEKCQPQSTSYLCEAIASADWQTIFRHASRLVTCLRFLNSSDANNAAIQRLMKAAQELDGLDLLRAATLGCELNALSPTDRDTNLDRALQSAFTKMARATDPCLAPLSATLQAEVSDVTADLSDKLRLLDEELSKSVERFRSAEQEVERLRSVVEIIKTSAGEEKVGLRNRALREFVLSLVPMFDEMQRRSEAGDQSARQLQRDIAAAFQSAGVIQLGSVGSNEVFDPNKHRLLQDQESPVRQVVIVRSGFLLTDGKETIVIRHALVRPVEETAH